jgi:hypothetical protein
MPASIASEAADNSSDQVPHWVGAGRGSVHAEESLPRRHDAGGVPAAGLPGAAGGAGAASAGEPYAVPWRTGAEREVAWCGDAVRSWAWRSCRRAWRGWPGRGGGPGAGEASGGHLGAAAQAGVSDRDRAVCSVWRADEGDRRDRGPGGGGADSQAPGAVGGGERGARDGGAAGAACVAVEVRPDQRKDVWSGRDRRALRSRSRPVRGALAKVGKLAGNEADGLLRKARAARLGTGRKGRRRASENGSVLRGWRLFGLSVSRRSAR